MSKSIELSLYFCKKSLGAGPHKNGIPEELVEAIQAAVVDVVGDEPVGSALVFVTMPGGKIYIMGEDREGGEVPAFSGRIDAEGNVGSVIKLSAIQERQPEGGFLLELPQLWDFRVDRGRKTAQRGVNGHAVAFSLVNKTRLERPIEKPILTEPERDSVLGEIADDAPAADQVEGPIYVLDAKGNWRQEFKELEHTFEM